MPAVNGVGMNRKAGEESREANPRIPGSFRLGRGAAMLLMPGARSKRCRENRPLIWEGRLAERERPGLKVRSSMQDQVALGALALTLPLSRAASPALLAHENAGGKRLTGKNHPI